MKRSALIVAGGSGTRMGAALPKQFLPLGAKPILLHTVEKFLSLDDDLELVLALPKAHFSLWEEVVVPHMEYSPELLKRIHLCAGGPSRTESVYNGLEKLHSVLDEPQKHLVAIHDGVRPFIRVEEIKHAFDLAEEKGASVVCVSVKSSIREELGEGQSRAVDRSRFYHVQTPQTFHLAHILQAYTQRPHNNFTDDASLYEAPGASVAICEGSYENIKITTPEDLDLAEIIYQRHQNG